MDPLIATVTVALAVLGAAMLIAERRRWAELHVEHGPPRVSGRLHGALRAQGLRSRYQVRTSLACVGGPMARIQEARVLVHRDDLRRARQVQSALRDDGA